MKKIRRDEGSRTDRKNRGGCGCRRGEHGSAGLSTVLGRAGAGWEGGQTKGIGGKKGGTVQEKNWGWTFVRPRLLFRKLTSRPHGEGGRRAGKESTKRARGTGKKKNPIQGVKSCALYQGGKASF